MARDAVCPTVQVSPSCFRELRVNPQSPALSNSSPHMLPGRLLRINIRDQRNCGRGCRTGGGWLSPHALLFVTLPQCISGAEPRRGTSGRPEHRAVSVSHLDSSPPPKTDVMPTESAGTANKAQKRKYG
jgi:hypothetical protein